MTALGCATAASMTHGIPVSEIMGHGRKREIVKARWDAWAIGYLSGWTLEKTSTEFKCHESSIRHALQAREERKNAS